MESVRKAFMQPSQKGAPPAADKGHAAPILLVARSPALPFIRMAGNCSIGSRSFHIAENLGREAVLWR
jgi:hypothetical protein